MDKKFRERKKPWFYRIFGDTDRSFARRTIQGLPFLSDRTKDAMSRETTTKADMEPERPLPEAEIDADSSRQAVQERESALARERIRRERREQNDS